MTESRDAGRYRRAAWASTAHVLSRAAGLLVMLASVPLTLPYLGAERFGLWMLLASLVGLLGFLDLGVGNALVNGVAVASTRDDAEGLRRTIGDGLAVMLVIATLIGGVTASLAGLGPLAAWLKVVDPALADELRTAALQFAGWFALQLFSASILRIFAGLQRAYIAHLAVAAGYCVSLLALFCAARAQAPIPVLLAATLGVNALAPLPLLAVLAREKLVRWPWRVPAQRALPLLRSGGLFLLLQIGVMVGWSVDPLIISRALGLADVAIYSVAQRVFQFVTQPLMILNAPLWAAYAEAQARGDRGFVARTLRASLLRTGLLAAAGAAVLLLAAPALLQWWTRSTVTPPFSLLLLFALWSVVEATGNAFAMFLNGAGIVRAQVAAVLLFCLLALPAKVWLAARFGVSGVVLAGLAAYLLTMPLGYWLVGRREISRALATGAT